MNKDDLLQTFARLETRDLLIKLTSERQDYTNEALELMSTVLSGRFPSLDVKDPRELERCLVEFDENAANEDARLIEQQTKCCNACGAKDPSTTVSIYACLPGKKRLDWSQILPGILVSAFTVPLLGVGRVHFSREGQYSVVEVPFLLCSHCSREYGGPGIKAALLHSVLIQKLYEQGYEIHDQASFSIKFEASE